MMYQLNTWLARHVTLAFGSMWCAYAFLVLALIPVFEPSTMATIAFISSGVIQLVALPIILVGSRVLSAASEARAKKDHETLMQEHANVKHLLTDLHDLHKDTHRVMRCLAQPEKKKDGKRQGHRDRQR